MELGSVTLKRIGFFCFPIKHSTHTYVAWLSAALCVVVTMLLSTKLILRHLEYYGNPDTQKYVVRILFMAPIYAVDSLLALTFVGWATTYIDVFRDCYEVCVWVWVWVWEWVCGCKCGCVYTYV